jgi:hypothetical protein
MIDQLYESLANLQHQIWSRWMIYMFNQGAFNPDGTWTMPKEKVERWQRQMNTLYSMLPDHEKVSDRELAGEILTLVRQ